MCVYIYRHTALRQPGSRQTPAAISTLPAKILASTVRYKKEPRILGEMADSRAGAGKEQDGSGTPHASFSAQRMVRTGLKDIIMIVMDYNPFRKIGNREGINK